MFLAASKSGREYLYMQSGPGDILMIVDVTNAKKPLVVKRYPIGPGSVASSIRLVTPNLGIVLPGRPQSNLARADKVVQVLDLSDPLRPRVLLQLRGVSSMLTDNTRGLLFVASEQGLWIIQDRSLLTPGLKAWRGFEKEN